MYSVFIIKKSVGRSLKDKIWKKNKTLIHNSIIHYPRIQWIHCVNQRTKMPAFGFGDGSGDGCVVWGVVLRLESGVVMPSSCTFSLGSLPTLILTLIWHSSVEHLGNNIFHCKAGYLYCKLSSRDNSTPLLVTSQWPGPGVQHLL